ncbi:MAG TPA: hypothetical protein VGD88_02870 [Opitutaceae bacterium]
MNKTLLLIICDFLLLNLLALTSWETAEPARPAATPAAAQNAPGARTADQDMVALMQLSLEDERAQREQLASQLESTASTLAAREQNLAALQSERTQLTSTLEQTRQSAAALSQQVEAASRDASMSKERLAQLQRDLEQREAEAARQRDQLATLEKQQAEARQRIESLNVAVQVAEQEKGLLRDTAETFRQQAENERIERQKVQEANASLAQGVGQLAEKSADLTKEIRDNRPINANTLFSDFVANRVSANFAAVRQALLGPLNRASDARTVLVTDGKATYALLHVDDTPFAIRELAPDWTALNVTFSKGMYRTTAPAIHFLGIDPRVVAVPVEPSQVAALGAKVYEIAADPFKFPDALLIANGGTGYGEVPFKLDPTNPRYVKMDNRLVRRLFGDFAPSRGDLVLSKTGELLGIMVNSDHCAIVNDFLPGRTIRTGPAGEQKTSELFSDLAGRIARLPVRLQ